MIDWLSSMTQTFEYYIVDPSTWKDVKKLNSVKSCTINRDSESETLGSATIEIAESIGECYVRVYLIAIQNGLKYKYPLGTYLVQTPTTKFDGKTKTISVDAYTPLLELKENPPDLGYSIFKGENIMDNAYRLCREHARAPVVKAECDTTLYYDFVANTSDTWVTYLTDLIANAKYSFDLDELGRILFAPKQDTASLQPVWTFTDDNSSILYPDVTLDEDLYGIPNVVEVIYSASDAIYYAKAVNDDSNSPTSTVNRGREIRHRVVDPEITGNPTKGEIDLYAERLLKEMSVLERVVTYSHGYCPVRVGDCVRLNYERAGITNAKAKVISQSISCGTGCKVTEKAVFTEKLWR